MCVVHLSAMIMPECLWRIAVASRVTNDLEDVWRQQNLSLTTKLVCTRHVIYVLLYGATTWRLTEREWLKFQAFDTNCQRRIFTVKWHDFVTSESISAITGLDDIRDIV